MGSGRSLVFLSHILINVVGLGISQPDFLFYNCSEGFGNYTINSVYQTNLNTLLSSLSSDTDSYGFNSSSFGESPDRVNAIALCRGDIDLDTCRGCINDATSNITQVCPNNNKEFFGGYDLCMVQYSNESINGITTLFPSVCMFSPEKASNANPFNQALRTLLDRLSSQAASGGTHRKFATGNVTVQVNQTIYGLMQCTPNLSEEDCSNCLSSNIGYFSTLAGDSLGGRFIAPSCNLRYEIWLFFGENSTGAPSGIAPSGIGPSDIAPSGIAPSGRYVKRKRTVIVVVISTITSAVAVIVCVLILSWKCKQRMPRDEVVVSEAVDKISTLESLQHNFVTLKNATENFSDDNKLGKGGFGVVYKGRLKNGQEIAVKRLSVNSGQGEVEFKNEAMLVARLQHRNLVRLLGFCLEGKERLLIYELVTNSSLDQYIFGNALDPIKSSLLDWDRRYKIIGGIARGLLYLHEDSRLRIIHRDLKASNVLLDAEMNPKISDFGMARLFVLDETEGNTNRIVGTFGYMAPEYAMHGHFSIKSDVFSFGVLVLEIITGQKNSYFQKGENGENLLSFAWKSWLEGKGSNLIDPTLETNSDSICEIERCFHIGLLCVQESIGNRPTMSSVVQMLKTSSFTLSMPSEPAFFPRSNIDPQNSVFLESVDDASITGCYPR